MNWRVHPAVCERNVAARQQCIWLQEPLSPLWTTGELLENCR